MISFELNIQIYRPAKQVFDFVARPENDFQWQYGTLASAQVSKGEIGLGTLIHTIGYFMGRRIEFMNEVTDFEPTNRYGFDSLTGPVDTHTLYVFETHEGGTKINLAIKTNTRDLFKPNDAGIEKKFKKQYKENLAMLKNVLETHPIAVP